MTSWVISDSHFGHAHLLDGPHPARPFASVAQMNAHLVEVWNSHVRPGDIVYHLGDVYLDDGWRALQGLQGTKHLILGNHDDPRDPRLTEVFDDIHLWKVFADQRTVLTHLPMDLSPHSGLGDRFDRNIHGHLHHRPAPSARHVCVSVEQTGYAPVNLDDLFCAPALFDQAAPPQRAGGRS